MAKERRLGPKTWHAGLALAITVAGAVGLFVLFRLPATWYHGLAAWLLAVNLTTFGYYGYDKACAQSNARRTPEVVLHGLVFAGGTVGAYLAMQLFRHKTIKGTFRIAFWWIVVLQAMLIAAVIYRLVRG